MPAPAMSSALTPLVVVQDCRGLLQLVLTDGTIVGSFAIPAFSFPLRRDDEADVDLPSINNLPSLVIAPENRLPAAIEDAGESILWLRAQAAWQVPHPWLSEAADMDRVFISGETAGGNIIHNLK